MQIVGTIDSYLVNRATGLPAQPPTLSGDVIVDEGGNFLVTQGGYRIRWTPPLTGFSFSQTKKSDDTYIEVSEDGTVATFKQINNELPEPGYHWVSSDTDLNELYGQKIYLEYEVYDATIKLESGELLHTYSGHSHGGPATYDHINDEYLVGQTHTGATVWDFHRYDPETFDRLGLLRLSRAEESGLGIGTFTSIFRGGGVLMGVFSDGGVSHLVVITLDAGNTGEFIEVGSRTTQVPGNLIPNPNGSGYLGTYIDSGTSYLARYTSDYTWQSGQDIALPSVTMTEVQYDSVNDQILLIAPSGGGQFWRLEPDNTVTSDGLPNVLAYDVSIDSARNRFAYLEDDTAVRFAHFLQDGTGEPQTILGGEYHFSFGLTTMDGTKAKYFRGSNTQAILPSGVAEQLRDDELTFSAWVQVPSGILPETKTVLALSGPATTSSDDNVINVNYYSDEGRFGLFHENPNGGTAGTIKTGTFNFEPDTWHHVVAVTSSNRKALYVNNVLEAESFELIDTSIAHQFIISGEYDSGQNVTNRFIGSISNVKVFNSPLGVGDIGTLYGEGFTDGGALTPIYSALGSQYFTDLLHGSSPIFDNGPSIFNFSGSTENQKEVQVVRDDGFTGATNTTLDFYQPEQVDGSADVHMLAIDGASDPNQISVWSGVNGVWHQGNPTSAGSGSILVSRGSPGFEFPVGPLYLGAHVHNNSTEGLEMEYKVRVRGSGAAPFNYPIPTGFNQFT